MKSINLLYIVPVLFGLTFSSCNKNCDLPEDTNSGEILKNYSVFPDAGYLTSGMTDGDYLIQADHDDADRYEISTDGGKSKSLVNYNTHNIVCCPLTTTCNASFNRSVEIDDALGIVIYKIEGKECDGCEERRSFENYQVIPAVPESYEILIETNITPQ